MGNWLDTDWQGLTPEQELKKIEENYPSSLHTSIDLVVLEKCDNVYVRRCNFGWTDVGSWPEIYDVAEKDADGNAVLANGHVLLSGCRNNLVDLPETLAPSSADSTTTSWPSKATNWSSARTTTRDACAKWSTKHKFNTATISCETWRG